MPKFKIRGTNWRDNLSQQRQTPEEIQGQQLRNQKTAAQIEQIPLQNEAQAAALSRAQSAEAKARYDLGKEIDTDRQKTAFYNGLQELESNLDSRGFKLGTKEHAEAFAAYAHAFPLARSSADVDKTLQLHAKINDDQAALTDRINTVMAAAPAGYKPQDVTMTSTGQPSVRFGSGAPTAQAMERYARVQGQITGYQDAAKAEEATNIAAKKAGVPFSQASQLHAAQTEAAILEKQFPQLAQPATTAADTATAAATASTPAGTQPVTGIVSPTPAPQTQATATPDPRIDLAKRALTDPNATDAHKAAARQILGVPEDNAQ